MATPTHHQIQNQNLNFVYNGTAPVAKNDISKAVKRGGLGGRKALNDISNSRKPSTFNSVKKENSINVIYTDKDPSAIKGKSSRAADKGKLGRKALTDLTNSVKPLPKQQAPSLGRKLNAVAENVYVPSCIAEEEGFLHDHGECIKTQMANVDKDYFLNLVGLGKPSAPFPLSPKKLESNMKHSELPEHVVEDEVSGWWCSPAGESPPSPKAPYMSWEWENDNFSDLMMI